MTLKVGDKLRHINCACLYNNMIGTIISIRDSGAPIIRFIQENGVNIDTVLPWDTYELVPTNSQLEFDL